MVSVIRRWSTLLAGGLRLGRGAFRCAARGPSAGVRAVRRRRVRALLRPSQRRRRRGVDGHPERYEPLQRGALRPLLQEQPAAVQTGRAAGHHFADSPQSVWPL